MDRLERVALGGGVARVLAEVQALARRGAATALMVRLSGRIAGGIVVNPAERRMMALVHSAVAFHPRNGLPRASEEEERGGQKRDRTPETGNEIRSHLAG